MDGGGIIAERVACLVALSMISETAAAITARHGT